MSLSSDFKTYLQSLATAAGDQVYYDHPPQSAAVPFVAFTVAPGGQYHDTLDGSPLAETVYHVYSYGATKPDAENLSDGIRKQLQHFSGDMGATPVDTVYCNSYGDGDTDKPTDGSYAVRYWDRKIYTITHQI